MTVTLEILTGPDYQRDEDGWENHAYTVRLRCDGRYMDTEWHQGLGITDDPTAESVLENLLGSLNATDYSFEEWAADYGYDEDSRKAERIYNAVVEESKRLRRLLGVSNVARLGQYEDDERAARALAGVDR